MSANRHIINVAPLQLYSSAIIFAPQASVIRNVCGRLPDWVEQPPIAPKTWYAELHRWEGHREDILVKPAFSPDGLLLATATMDNVVRVWNARTGYETLHLKGHHKTVGAVAFSSDGSRITSVSRDQTIRLWDAKTGRETLQKLQRNLDRFDQVVFSPGNDSVIAYNETTNITGHHSDIVRLWDTRETGTDQIIHKDDFWATSVTFSPNGLLLGIVSHDRGLSLWHVETKQRLCEMEGYTELGLMPVFSLSDTMLAAASSSDHIIRLWDLQTGQIIQQLKDHTITDAVTSVAFSHDSLVLASASRDSTIQLWNTDTWQKLHTLSSEVRVNDLVFSYDGLLLAALCEFSTVRIFDVTSGQEKRRLQGHTNNIHHLVFSPDSSLIASAAYDGTVRLWNTMGPSTMQEAPELKGHSAAAWVVSFSPDGSKLASRSVDGQILVWDTESGTVLYRLECYTLVGYVLFSADGSLLVSSDRDGIIRVWDLSIGEEKFRLDGWPQRKPNSGLPEHLKIVLSPYNSLLASTPRDGTITLWDLQTGRERWKLEGQSRMVTDINFSPDGSVLASTDSDGKLRLWDITTQNLLLDVCFEGRDPDGDDVVFSENGLLFALKPHVRDTSHRLPILIGNVRDGRISITLSVDGNHVNAMAFSPDASLFAAATDGVPATQLGALFEPVVHLWSLSTGELIQSFENYRAIYDIKFADDGRTLLTNRGSIPIDTAKAETAPKEPQSYANFIMNDDWIESRNKRILWLPVEYRCGLTAVHGNMLAIGQESGTVSFLRLRYPSE